MSEAKQDKTYVAIPNQFLAKVLAYLAQRPFQEVAHFFAEVEKVGVPVEDPKQAAETQK